MTMTQWRISSYQVMTIWSPMHCLPQFAGPTWFRRLYLALAAGGRVVALAEDQLTRGAPLARPGRAVPAGQLREHSFALLPSENWQYEDFEDYETAAFAVCSVGFLI